MLRELFIVVILSVLTQAVTVSITLTQCFKTKYLPIAVVQLVNIFKCLAYDWTVKDE
jgi:hypothetical protein